MEKLTNIVKDLGTAPYKVANQSEGAPFQLTDHPDDLVIVAPLQYVDAGTIEQAVRELASISDFGEEAFRGAHTIDSTGKVIMTMLDPEMVTFMQDLDKAGLLNL